MKFGTFSLAEAEGVILAHTCRIGALTLKKGHVLTAVDIAALKTAGLAEIVGARSETGDVAEDAAAARIARRLAGANIALSAAHTGRCNLEAAADGVVLVDAKAVTAANLVNEAVTIATLADKQAAQAGQVVATVKIIPFAVGGAVMAQMEGALGAGAVRLTPYAPRRFAILSTMTPGLKPSIVSSTEEITRQRIAALGGSVVACAKMNHSVAALTHGLQSALKAGAEIILVAGASATVDRGDVAPAAIVAAGGAIDHFGMPVDPGNLLVLAHIGKVPVMVLPGCARSPKLNGADWVMQRLAAGVPITPRDIMEMGVGGLLVDTPARPLPRASAVQATPTPGSKVAAVILAAGQSRRMGGANKLLMSVDGEPLIRRTVAAALGAGIAEAVVVTGHQQDEVAAVLKGLKVKLVHNPRYAEGLSTSLKTGLETLAPDIAGALICLGDMPAVTAAHLRKLLADFSPDADRAIGVPIHNGKRGNPVLWARRFFADMKNVAGDVGARHLIGANESLVYEVEFGDTAVLTDLDTPAQWQEYLSKPRG